jgi:hypothetical protein
VSGRQILEPDEIPEGGYDNIREFMHGIAAELQRRGNTSHEVGVLLETLLAQVQNTFVENLEKFSDQEITEVSASMAMVAALIRTMAQNPDGLTLQIKSHCESILATGKGVRVRT